MDRAEILEQAVVRDDRRIIQYAVNLDVAGSTIREHAVVGELDRDNKSRMVQDRAAAGDNNRSRRGCDADRQNTAVHECTLVFDHAGDAQIAEIQKGHAGANPNERRATDRVGRGASDRARARRRGPCAVERGTCRGREIDRRRSEVARDRPADSVRRAAVLIHNLPAQAVGDGRCERQSRVEAPEVENPLPVDDRRVVEQRAASVAHDGRRVVENAVVEDGAAL